MNQEQLDDEQAKTKKKDAKRVFYIGEDDGYWEELVEGLKKYKQINFDFQQFNERKPERIQALLKKIQEERPKVVYVDLEKNTDAMIHILRAQLRMNSPYVPFMVALSTYTQGEEMVKQAIMAGCKCVHMKSGEFDSIIYDTICMSFHEALEHHGFAMAKLDDEIKAYLPAKVSLVSPEGIKVESNHSVILGNDYILNTHWSRTGVIESNRVFVSSQTREDLFYNFTYAQEFGFEFIPPLDLEEGTDPEEAEKLAQEHEEKGYEIEETMYKWISDNIKLSRPKNLKALVIDKELGLYNNQPLTDSYDFVVRLQPYLVKPKAELTQLKPQMIAFNFEDLAPEDMESSQDVAHMFNEINTLKHLIKTIKSMTAYEPFIVAFNTTISTERLKEILDYNQIIGHSVPLSADILVKMGNILIQRLNEKVETPMGQIILDKKLPCTYAELETTIKIVALSENDVYFNPEEELEIGTVFRIDHPSSIYITVAEPPKRPKADSRCFGIVHGVGELEKKELRRFVNSVFFRPKEAIKEKEKEHIEKLKEQFLEKTKEEEEAKLEEARQAEEQKESENSQENDGEKEPVNEE
ncbi:MAG: hypothetical protein CME64_13365 [Halobacteriovoraceae bacterium]|nr:hypothetical protein [Halobacteriovoraceae bacterium]|tara:strand:- start:19627 stop:21372 length:1746 start_codon:yes stop_codon:yes gene_type:complete